MSRIFALSIAVALVFLTGCSQKTSLYSWGSYERLVYEMYVTPGSADHGTQVAKLTADVERAQAEGARIPPGIHAHLGYLYYGQGQADLAVEEFRTERELYPESAVFIDGILARMAN
jgi:hypothetical protein